MDMNMDMMMVPLGVLGESVAATTVAAIAASPPLWMFALAAAGDVYHHDCCCCCGALSDSASVPLLMPRGVTSYALRGA